MLLNQDYFDPPTITGYARGALADLPVNQFTLSRWLPWRPIDDITFRFNRSSGGLAEAAPFRAWNTEARIVGRKGITRVSGELLPISDKIVLSEYDNLRRRANPDSAIQTEIKSDVRTVVRNIAARLELARGESLVTGALDLSEFGLDADIDWGRDSSMEVTAGTLWSTTASADIIQDLTDWVEDYTDLNGEPPSVLLVSRRVRGFMLRNAALRTMAGTLAGTPTQISSDTLRQILDAHDLPRVETYDVKYDNNGTSTRVIDDHLALLLPEPTDPNDAEGTDLGATFLGTTAESLDASYNLAEDEAPGIVAGVYRDEDPIGIWTKASAVGLPVLANPNLAMVATVATDI